MKKLFYILAVSLCPIFISHYSFAQNSSIDSLLTLINSEKEDTNKVIHLNALCREFGIIGNYAECSKRGKEALELALKLKPVTLNVKKILVVAYKNAGHINMDEGNYPEALKIYFSVLKMQEEFKDMKDIALTYDKLGLIYLYQSNYPEAIKNNFKELKIWKDLLSKITLEREKWEIKQKISDVYEMLGLVYTDQGNFPEALSSYYISLKIYEEIKDKKGISTAFNNIGMIYDSQGNSEEALNKYFASLKIREEIRKTNPSDNWNIQCIACIYDNIGIIYRKQGVVEKTNRDSTASKNKFTAALKNHFASLKIRESIGDKDGIAMACYNIGSVYFELGNSIDALKKLTYALSLTEKTGNKKLIAASFIALGTVKIKLCNLVEAKFFLNRGLQIAIEIGNKELIKDNYSALTNLDSLQGNFKDAFNHHKLFISYRDSIYNEETKKKTIQSAMTYEFEKKEIATKAAQEKLDAVTREEKQKQTIIIYAVGGVLLLVILFSIFLFNRFRITRRQKLIIEKQKVLVDKAYEHLHEKNKEVLDSIYYARRIQNVLITSEKYISKTLGRLMN